MQITILQQCLQEQLLILKKGLDIHNKVCPENMLKLQESLEQQYYVMKKSLL